MAFYIRRLLANQKRVSIENQENQHTNLLLLQTWIELNYIMARRVFVAAKEECDHSNCENIILW